MLLSKQRIFLAILHNSKQVQFFYFGIGIVYLKSESKNYIESLFSNSTRLYASLWYYIIVVLELFTWLASPKIENWWITCVLLRIANIKKIKKSEDYFLL